MTQPNVNEAPSVRWSTGDLLCLAVFGGILAGFAQVGIVLLKRYLGRGLLEELGPHMVWMTPATTVALFVVAALLLALLGRFVPRLATPVSAIAVFGFLGVLGISLYKGGIHPVGDALFAAGGATVLVRALRPRLGRFLRLARAATPWLVVVVVLLAIGMSVGQVIAERRRASRLGAATARANIILLVLDTVRAQSLGLYGYARPTTPELARWARRGILFRRALAPSSWTLPSHGSMFTGRPAFQLSADWMVPLNDQYPTLAEYLGARGYMTAGFVANLSYCGRGWGLARGFVHYEDFPLSVGEFLASSKVVLDVLNSPLVRRLIPYRDFLGRKNAATINHDFLHWLDRRPSRPFFAFLNYFDVHQPVVPPPEFERLFAGPVTRRWDIVNYDLHQGTAAKPKAFRLSPAEIQAEVNAYDAGVAALDHEVGQLLDQLDRRGLLDSSVVFITSDHGEMHGEHGKYGHGNSLYRLVTQVPLLMLTPDHRAGVVEEFVSLRDFAASALDAAGIGNDGTFPACGFVRGAGESPTAGGDRSARCPPVTAEFSNEGKPWAAVYEGRFHFLVGPRGLEQLYDWEADPDESQDLARDPAHRAVADRMRKATDSLLATVHPPLDAASAAAAHD